MQEDLLRQAYKRSVHRSYIEGCAAALGHSVLPKESVNTGLRIRTID